MKPYEFRGKVVGKPEFILGRTLLTVECEIGWPESKTVRLDLFLFKRHATAAAKWLLPGHEISFSIHGELTEDRILPYTLSRLRIEEHGPSQFHYNTGRVGHERGY